MTPAEQVKQAVALRLSIEASGGLASLSDLARRFGISPTRMSQLAACEDFPEPLGHVAGGRYGVYAVAEVDRWKAERPGPGRPWGQDTNGRPHA